MVRSREELSPHGDRRDMTGSGDPLYSSLDHLLLEPFHLKRNICTDVYVYFFGSIVKYFSSYNAFTALAKNNYVLKRRGPDTVPLVDALMTYQRQRAQT